MICPSCNGTKKIFALFPIWADSVPEKDRKIYADIPCHDCNNGEVDDRYNEWLLIVKSMKAERISRKITLRKEAARRGMDASILSKMERGFIKPVKL